MPVMQSGPRVTSTQLFATIPATSARPSVPTAKAVLGQPEERHADEGRHDGGGQRGRDEVGEEWPVGARGEDGRRVGADAEERRMGEREAADVAHDEVVGQRQRGEERGEDEDVQDVALLRGDHRRHQPGCPTTGGREDQRGRPPHLRSRSDGRKRPCGRQSSTAIMIRKAMGPCRRRTRSCRQSLRETDQKAGGDRPLT